MNFPTTQWTQLAEATLSGDTAGRAALESLCSNYRRPVTAFLRMKGFEPVHAEDLAQDFFLELLRSQAWKRADQARGRFRTFLLGALNHVISRERAHLNAVKRGGGQFLASLDELGSSVPLESNGSGEEALIFDREWALQTMNSALTAVEQSIANSGQAGQWPVLVQFLPGAGEPPAYDAAAAQLGISLPALKSNIHRVRQQLRQQLRALVAQTVSGPHEIDSEMDWLHRVMVHHG